MMKPVFAILALAFFVCAAAVTGYSFETSAQDEAGRTQVEKLGHFFMPIAQQFGCDVFSSGDLLDGGKRASLEYLPAGVAAKDWTRKVTISIHLIPEGEDGKKEMKARGDELLNDLSAHTAVLSKSLYKNKAGEQGAFIEYKTGTGAEAEHKAGVFMRASSAMVAFMQLHVRGAALSAEDRLKMNQLISPGAH